MREATSLSSRSIRKCMSKRTGREIQCDFCGKDFYAPDCRIRGGIRFCSMFCRRQCKDYNFSCGNGKRGKKLSQEHREKISIAHKKIPAEKHARWSGDSVGYTGVHLWIQKYFGTSDHCDICGKIDVTTKQGKSAKRNIFEWSNRNHLYKRSAQDWWQLCASCHRRYDMHFLDSYARVY